MKRNASMNKRLGALALTVAAALMMGGAGATNELPDVPADIVDVDRTIDHATKKLGSIQRWDPPAPDLCDDEGDTWERVYEVTPAKDATVLVTPEIKTGPLWAMKDLDSFFFKSGILLGGDLFYHAEIWKCEDYNYADEVRYLGYKSGYDGSGNLWRYGDAHYESDVECYYAVILDVGQVPCELWATTPPTYTEPDSAWFSVGSKTFSGAGEWEPVTSGLVDIAWDGNFDSVYLEESGTSLVIHADLIGLDQGPPVA